MISADSLRYNQSKPSNLPAGAVTTNFGNLNVHLKSVLKLEFSPF